MNINVLKQGTGEVTFTVEKTYPAFVNTMRRMFVDEVPTLAIEDVEFRENSSILYDETVAHRLGLLPIKTDLRSYTLPDVCKCEGEGCAKCQLKLKLKAEGPCVVLAENIKSTDAGAKLIYPKTPIIKLLKDQKLEFEAIAVLGRGREHMKWSPGLFYYKYMPKIKTGAVKDADAVVRACPQKVFERKSGRLSVVKGNLFNCHLCGDCERVSGGAVVLEPSGQDFIVTVESWGQLTCKAALLKGCEIFDAKLDEFAKVIKK